MTKEKAFKLVQDKFNQIQMSAEDKEEAELTIIFGTIGDLYERVPAHAEALEEVMRDYVAHMVFGY